MVHLTRREVRRCSNAKTAADRPRQSDNVNRINATSGPVRVRVFLRKVRSLGFGVTENMSLRPFPMILLDKLGRLDEMLLHTTEDQMVDQNVLWL